MVEYQLKESKTLNWKERHEHYIGLGIPDIWILSSLEYGKGKDQRSNKVQFFEELVHNRGFGNKLYFFNTDNNTFTLVKKMDYLRRKNHDRWKKDNL